MNKLLIGVIVGIVLVTLGSIMISYSTYFSSVSYSQSDCYNLYPPTLINNATYNYSHAYYSCQNNQTLASANTQLYSSLMSIPGLVLLFVGGITIVISTVLLLLATYKDRKKQSR